MGIGTITYRRKDWTRLRHAGRIFLHTLEVTLYLAFMADCFILLAGVAHTGRGATPMADPTGGGSLIVVLLAIGLVSVCSTGRLTNANGELTMGTGTSRYSNRQIWTNVALVLATILAPVAAIAAIILIDLFPWIVLVPVLIAALIYKNKPHLSDFDC